MAKTLLFIVNPRAGRTRTPVPFFDIVSAFGEEGWLLSVRQTSGRGDATRFIVQDGAHFDAVVCCGGDGTLNEAVNGILQLPSPPPLGYIPCGSTNDFAASLRLPSQPMEAARQIMASRGELLDVGLFNQRPFVYVASFGAFTSASYSAPQSVKNQLGHLAYILQGVKDLASLRPYHAVITTEEETFSGDFLFGAVTNATSVGGLMKLREELVQLDDGQFELFLVPNPKTVAELQILIRSLLTQDYTGEGFIFRHTSRLSVDCQDQFPWALDGEFDPGARKVEISNEHKKLNFLR